MRLFRTILITCLLAATLATGFLEPAFTQSNHATGTKVVETREIADLIIKSFGGAAAVNKMKTAGIKSVGHMSVISGISGATNSFDCTTYSRDDKVRIETVVMAQKRIIAYDGKHSWTQAGDWISAGSSTTTKRVAEEENHGLTALADMLEPNCKIQLAPPATVQNHSCDVLKVMASDGKPTTLYADKKTHLILKTEYLGTDPERGVPAIQAMEYLDYRPVSGMLLPFKTLEYSDSKPSSEDFYDRMDVVDNLDDKLFQMPPESIVEAVKENPVVIPFTFLANQILIKVRLGSTKEYMFLVDTGASQCVLDKATATTLGPYSASNFSITGGSKAMPLSYMTLPNFSLGRADLHDVAALVSDLSPFTQSIGIRPDGIIGSNVLCRFLVTIDYSDKTLTLANPLKVTVPPSATVIPTSPIFGATAIVVSSKLDDKLALNCLVDTGAALNNLPEQLAKQLGLSPLLPVGEIAGIDGHRVGIGSARLKSIKIGPLSVKNPVFVLSPSPDTTSGVAGGGVFTDNDMGILGNPIWSHFRTTIDYRNERLFLEPNSKGPALSMDNQLELIRANYLKTNSLERAIKDYQALATAAETQQLPEQKSLALLGLGNCYAEKYRETKNDYFRSLSQTTYRQAMLATKKNPKPSTNAMILAAWARLDLQPGNSADGIMAAQALIQQAAQLSPTEPGVYLALADLTVKANKPDNLKKLIDQTLMLDPANWDALWMKYQESVASKDPAQRHLVVEQLRHYYPDAARVKAITTARS